MQAKALDDFRRMQAEEVKTFPHRRPFDDFLRESIEVVGFAEKEQERRQTGSGVLREELRARAARARPATKRLLGLPDKAMIHSYAEDVLSGYAKELCAYHIFDFDEVCDLACLELWFLDHESQDDDGDNLAARVVNLDKHLLASMIRHEDVHKPALK